MCRGQLCSLCAKGCGCVLVCVCVSVFIEYMCIFFGVALSVYACVRDLVWVLCCVCVFVCVWKRLCVCIQGLMCIHEFSMGKCMCRVFCWFEWACVCMCVHVSVSGACQCGFACAQVCVCVCTIIAFVQRSCVGMCSICLCLQKHPSRKDIMVSILLFRAVLSISCVPGRGDGNERRGDEAIGMFSLPHWRTPSLLFPIGVSQQHFSPVLHSPCIHRFFRIPHYLHRSWDWDHATCSPHLSFFWW